MNLPESNSFTLYSDSPLEDILIRKLLLSHDPDGRRLDSEQLLFAMENVMLYAATSEVVLILSSIHFVSFDISSII